MDVVLDTSVLINFLRVGRLDLLRDHPDYTFIVTDHVRAEIGEHFKEQIEAINGAVADGTLVEITVTDAAEVELFVQLSAMRSLGSGECSAVAVAINRALPVALDDVRAQKKVKAFHAGTELLDTSQIMVSLIQRNVLDLATADAIKIEWETRFRFKLNIASFGDLL